MKETSHAQCYKHTDSVKMSFAIHWFLLCVVIPTIVIAGNTARYSGIVLVFPAAVIIYCGSRLARIAAEGVDRIVEMTFWLYAYIFMGICAFLQIEAGRFPWLGHYSDDQIILSELIVLTGFAAFDFGRQLKIKSNHGASPNPGRWLEVSRNRLYFVSILGMALATYATLRLGAFNTLFLNRQIF